MMKPNIRTKKIEKSKKTKSLILKTVLDRVEAKPYKVNFGLSGEHGQFVSEIQINFVMDCYSRCVLGYALKTVKHDESNSVISSFKHEISKNAYETNICHQYMANVRTTRWSLTWSETAVPSTDITSISNWRLVIVLICIS